MSTFSLQTKKDVRTDNDARASEKDKPRESVGGPNGIANSHLGFQWVAARGDGKHKTYRKWGHRRRQFVGSGDLK